MSLTPSTFFSGFDDYFMTPFPTAPLLASPTLLTTLDRNAETVLRRASPQYEIAEDDKRFQLALDVPGVKAADMRVQLEHGGRVIRVSGERKKKEGHVSKESKFEKAFTLDSTIDVTKISANLSDGVLVVTAPKKAKEETVKTIRITEGVSPKQLLTEEKNKKDK